MIKQPQDHLKSRKKPARKSVWIAGDSELADELSDLEANLSREQQMLEVLQPGPRREVAVQTVAKLTEDVAAAKTLVRDSSIKFVFRALGAKKYDDLLSAHPPTEEQIATMKAQGEDNVPFNTDTFPIALIVASCIEPEMPPEEMSDWLSGDDWNQNEILTLFMTASQVNSMRSVVNLGKD